MSLKRKIDILFFIAILIFCGLFYSLFQSSRITRESSWQVSQAQQLLYTLEKVESDISRMEAAHRGFIITGKENFLEPVESIRKELSQNLQELDTLIRYTPDQKERLKRLNDFIEKKIVFSGEGANLRRKENITAALEHVSSGKGKIIMDSIFSLSKSMEREEIKLLNERTNQNEAYVVAYNYNYLFFSGFTFLLLLLVYLHVRKTTSKLIQYRNKQDELIEELNYQNRQLDDFAHLTSHNLRSPAVNIFSLINFLNENSSMEEYKLIFDKLSKVSKNLNETLNELIEVLQVKKDTQIEREKLYFEDVLSKVKESMQADIMLSQAEISSDFSQAKQIQYPKAYLESIFYNLLSNAIKYRSPERTTRIHIATRLQNEKIMLEVTDNGLGIDMDRFGDQVFGLRKIFHRRENAKGIGLFMTKAQVEALGGQISVQSKPNKGSTFSILFDAKTRWKAPAESSLSLQPKGAASARVQVH